jgi:phosphohistidine phosphatase
MNIYLLRHGPAVERGSAKYRNDSDRPLTAEGRAKVKRIALAMGAMKLRFDAILSSPFVRARETAELVAAGLKPQRKVTLCAALAADAEPAEILSYLASMKPVPTDVLLVGHQPYLGNLASLLLANTSPDALEFKKGGLAKLAVGASPSGRRATLEWLLTPRLMKLMV